MTHTDNKQENIKNRIGSALKSIARKSDMEVRFTPAQRPSGRITSLDRPALPQIDNDLNPENIAMVRGCADMHGLKKRLHNAEEHRRQCPNNPESAKLFDALEQARWESLGARQMAGVGHNLNNLLNEKFNYKRYNIAEKAGDIEFEDILHLKTRIALSGEKPPPAVQKALSLWDEWFENKLKDYSFDDLQNSLKDQSEFAALARSLIQKLDENADILPPGDESGTADAQEDESNDNQARAEDDDESQDQGETENDDSQDIDEDLSDGGDDEQSYDGESEQSWDEFLNEMMGDDADAPAGTPELRHHNENLMPGIEGTYKVYTTEFDEEVTPQDLADDFELDRLRQMLDDQLSSYQALVSKLANKLQRKLMARLNRHWKFDLEEGILDPARLARVVANPNTPLSFKQESEMPFKDTVVSLLIDNSGSMRGRPIAIAAMSTDLIARTLERCGLKVEILGFTTRAWKGGKARDKWIQDGRPEQPGRLNDLRHIIYKDAQLPWRRAKKNLGLMLKEGLLKENIDGEALAWAHNRLSQRREQRKILIVISDGAPVDDSTLSVNSSNILEADLRSVIHWIESRSNVELGAIGIGHDVTRYYQNAITINDAEGLAEALAGQLEDLFDVH